MSNEKKVHSLALNSLKEKKYRGILFLAGAFLILMIIVAISTAYLNDRSKRAVTELDLIAQQNILSHQLSENILNLDIHLSEKLAQGAGYAGVVKIANLPPEALESIKNIETQKRVFSEIVASLDVDGDTVVLADGRKVVIDGIQSAHLRGYVENMEKIWAPYLALINTFLYDQQSGTLNKEKSKKLVAYTRQNNQKLQTEIDDLHFGVAEFIHDKTAKVYRVQVSGLVGAFVLFLLMIFGALRQLFNADRQLSDARQQTTDILNTVNEGLFLIDKDLMISNEYSRNLEKIVGKNNLKGKTLLDVLHGSVTEQDIQSAKLFIDQLYNPWVLEELIQDLNPLRKVKITAPSAEGGINVKYLDFNFLRVIHEDTEEIEKVFVSVLDITESVHLQENLEKARLQHNRELEMIATILTVNQQHLNTFIHTTGRRINKMNEILKVSSAQNLNLQEKARLLFRETHSLKGDASALKLHAFVAVAERQEQELQQLLKNPSLSGNDFLGFTVSLNELLNLSTFIHDLLNRLRAISNTEITESPQKPSWENYFNQYAHDIAQREGKEIQLHFSGFHADIVNHAHFNDYKDIAIQLLKNAVVHGIETPTERSAQGKSTVGTIELALHQTQQGTHCLVVKDDGKGIMLDAIRTKAIQLGLVSQEQVSTLSKQQLLGFIFHAGFSTAEKQTEDAGKGIGMDIVKQLTRKMNANISIDSQPQQFTHMTIHFPHGNQ